MPITVRIQTQGARASVNGITETCMTKLHLHTPAIEYSVGTCGLARGQRPDVHNEGRFLHRSQNTFKDCFWLLIVKCMFWFGLQVLSSAYEWIMRLVPIPTACIPADISCFCGQVLAFISRCRHLLLISIVNMYSCFYFVPANSDYDSEDEKDDDDAIQTGGDNYYRGAKISDDEWIKQRSKSSIPWSTSVYTYTYRPTNNTQIYGITKSKKHIWSYAFW